MKVTVKLIGPLVYAAGYSENELAVSEPLTAGELLLRLNIGTHRPTIVTRNGNAVGAHDVLEDGDRIVISPIYSGG
jgi:sulfur carrier protein ThiS